MEWLPVSVFALLALTLLVAMNEWRRRGGAQRRDVVIALLPVVTVVGGLVFEPPSWTWIAFALYVVAPLLFLRIVRHLQPVPGAIYAFSVLLVAGASAAPFLGVPMRYAAAVWLGAVLAPYVLAGALLLRSALRRRGVIRRRMQYAALAATLTAVVWGLLAADAALDPAGVVTYVAFAGSYLWAFATPRPVRNAWRAVEFQRFVTATQGRGESLEERLEAMRQAAASLVEADAAYMLTEEDDGSLTMAQDDPFPEDDETAWRLLEEASDEPRVRGDWTIIGLNAPEQPRRALAIKMSEHRLFPGEDEETMAAVAQEIHGRYLEMVFRSVERAARESAEELAKFRSDYLRAVAHEVANPLTPIKMQLAILRRRYSDEAPRPFERIDKSLERVEALIRDVSTIARLGSAGIQLEIEDVDISGMVHDAADAYEHVAQDGGCKIVTDIEDGIRLPADGLRVRQIIDNLCSNAIKYSPDGGTVSILARARGGLAEIIIADEGLGMTQEQLQQLFSSYGRVHTDVAPQIPGTGMGLYIARQLARLHGGDLQAFSQGANQGTRFKLSLPLAGPPEQGVAAERPPLPGVTVNESA